MSTHTTIHLLVSPDALPAIRVNQTALATTAGEPTVYLHIEAEHRMTGFDHTATFTVSGPEAAVRQLLDDCQAALGQLPSPDDEHAEVSRCGS